MYAQSTIALADTQALGAELSASMNGRTLAELLEELRIANTDTLRWAYTMRGWTCPDDMARSALIMELVNDWAYASEADSYAAASGWSGQA